MKKILFFALVAIATLSCTPKSAMMTKAVILDSKPRATDAQMWYRIELPSYGIKTSVVTYELFEAGDTVLVHDKWRNYEIR